LFEPACVNYSGIMERQVPEVGLLKNPAAKGCAILAAVVVGVPLLVVAVVGVKTWVPLQRAGEALDELDQNLGYEAAYRPGPSGAIPAERMDLFLELRTVLVTACDEYGGVQRGFDSVAELESKDSGNLQEVGDVAVVLGSAALAITPFLAEFFELRNKALLVAGMGLEEYSYIYAVAYHDLLRAPKTLNEIFSDGQPISPEASEQLGGCLARQLESTDQAGAVETELKMMKDDPFRLVWQDGLPEAVQASVLPYREQLDGLFCGATAGLEMERDSSRALRVALE
jgi:hypothetical protein